ncbi:MULTISPECIES: transglutaminaseTgpA domain-containing protein [unclassified Acinetobacter]|uniref:transglutaminase family protein n=1 Tax=unclassified Acinetobacter TaxID=196816 RepID=UPI00190E23D2|nr:MULTISPECIES: DUF3488 and transglutaminase-like domain-containing protein [unclassified Acinetobacter]MBK0062370.1 DUF3488 domain-containing transglutaminase family protein [Acinetobacter sp. S55]MBK0066174.1 DUF3488 domain-containing transglutaminase family protein [Acinetobacter sp. S54]
MTSILYFCLIPLLAFIFIAQLVYMPITLLGVWAIMLVTMIWRYSQGKIAPVSKWLLIAFVLSCLAAIYTKFKSFWGVEAGVAVLSTCLFAKCLESKNIRDLLIVFNFGLFVSASLFLHSQSFVMTLTVLFCLIFCFIGLYRIQITKFLSQPNKKVSITRDLKHVAGFLSIALPFFIILFIFFPRLPPLWRVPIASNQGVTGMSDRMSPGDIAQLSQSSALAFRVTGDLRQLPQRQNMYWRAMVLDDYDGAVWTNNAINQTPVNYDVNRLKVLNYQYLSADPQQTWIMSLEHSVPTESSYQIYADGSIKPRRMVQRNQPILLSWVDSPYLEYQYNQQQIKQAQRMNFQPQPKTQKLAQRLWQQSNEQPELYIRNILHWFQQQGFIYTLSPEVLNGNRTDQFLFETKKGFCEHYASSFVLLMRYAGIPARVVIGYQGGQLAPDAKSWEVRQLDAHAWSEVYINGHWQRIDPTAVVAPMRVDAGMQQYLQQDDHIWGEQAGTFWKQQNFNLIKNMRVWSDYLGYQWQSKVVGYDVDRQKNLLSKLGFYSIYSYTLLMVFTIIFLIIVYTLWLWFKNRKEISSIERQIKHFQKKLPHNLKRQTSETFKCWMLRLAQHAQQRELFNDLIQIHEKIMFSGQVSDKDHIKFNQLLKVCASKIKYVEKTCHPAEN